MKLIGPFQQIITCSDIPLKGPVNELMLGIKKDAWILISDGKTQKIGSFDTLHVGKNFEIIEVNQPSVVFPGFIDGHTHICFAGNRIDDFSKKLEGKTYLEIAESGGGIQLTVEATRKAEFNHLVETTAARILKLRAQGVTTVEIKSGYGLDPVHEIHQLKAIKKAGEMTGSNVVPTCLAAHTIPKEYLHRPKEYLEMIVRDLFPEIKNQNLANRIDIFIEKSAFQAKESHQYLREIKKWGFDLTIHADQFTVGGSKLAVEFGARSADHLEASGDLEINMLAGSDTIPVVLPGASLGLGLDFAPARRILDAGGSLAVASDWNPGSAPMGQLLTQLAILAVYEKLTIPECIAAITTRAAAALGISDRGALKPGYNADFSIFNTDDYRDIIYKQGSLVPKEVWINGKKMEI
jgi:imidazolonepropionase